MERNFDLNSQIIFVDSHGVAHSALPTKWWGPMCGPQLGCNLLYVSGDDTKTDPYGRQIERATSVVHKFAQSAPGMYWCWPDEI